MSTSAYAYVEEAKGALPAAYPKHEYPTEKHEYPAERHGLFTLHEPQTGEANIE
jgi:hypothetical protein